MQRPVRTLVQPLVDFGRLVGGEVVENNINRSSELDPIADLVEEGEELLRAAALDQLAGGLAVDDVEGRHQAGSAVVLAVKGTDPGMAGLQAGPRRGRRRRGPSGRTSGSQDLEGLDPVRLQTVRFRMPDTVETAIPSLSACARHVQRLACSGGGGIASSIVSPTFSSGTGLRTRLRGNLRRIPQASCWRKRFRQRQTVGFDMPVACIFCDRVRSPPR